jgi:hypothetical protein
MTGLKMDFAGSKKLLECGLLALGYAALLRHLQQQRLQGLNFDSMLRFEQRNLAPESRLARRERFMLLWAQGTMQSGTVDLRLPQADSSTMNDLMRFEERLRLFFFV